MNIVVIAIFVGVSLLSVVGVGAIIIILSLRRVNTGNTALVERKGVFVKQLSPGIHWLVPFSERVKLVYWIVPCSEEDANTTLQPDHPPRQGHVQEDSDDDEDLGGEEDVVGYQIPVTEQIMTLNNIPVRGKDERIRVSCSLSYRIADPRKAVYSGVNPLAVLYDRAVATLRQRIQANDPSDLLDPSFARGVRDQLTRDSLEHEGISVTTFTVRDLRPWHETPVTSASGSPSVQRDSSD